MFGRRPKTILVAADRYPLGRLLEKWLIRSRYRVRFARGAVGCLRSLGRLDDRPGLRWRPDLLIVGQ